jgi:hypothetical protein
LAALASHAWWFLVMTHGFGSASGAWLSGADVYGAGVPFEGAAALSAAKITPTTAATMITPELAAAVTGEREKSSNLIMDATLIVA